MKNLLKSIALFMGLSFCFATTAQAQETVNIRLLRSGAESKINGETNNGSKVTVEVGSTVIFEVIPSENEFVFFTIGKTYNEGGKIVSNRNPYFFTATEDATYCMNFRGRNVDKDADLTADITVVATKGGKANVNGLTVAEFPWGEEVNLRAEAETGYVFTNWTNNNGETISEEALFAHVITGDMTYTANFKSINGEDGETEGGEDNGNGETEGGEDNGNGETEGGEDNGNGETEGDEDNGNGETEGGEDNGNGETEGDAEADVEEVEAEKDTAVIYDLNGRKIEKIESQGVYIINGKKVVK